jgi:hypothetical protein
MYSSLRRKLDRIRACSLEAVHDELARNLLHAHWPGLHPRSFATPRWTA